jgi:dUTPase
MTKFLEYNEYNILYLCVDNTSVDLVSKYETLIEKHNTAILEDLYPNSGFDIVLPEDLLLRGTVDATFVDFNIKCEMRTFHPRKNEWVPTGFYVYPRSSLSKTPLMLANHTGIIDSGYRGSILGAFRNLSSDNFFSEKHARLLQICSPDLRPIVVEMVTVDFFETTSRGQGGFGSTGV